MPEYTPSGNVLLKYRKEDKCSIRKQAEKINIGPSYLCDISRGNRDMTVPVLKKIVKAYKYRCVGDDFFTLASACYDSEMLRRYKTRTHTTDNIQAIKDLIFITTGEVL